MGWWVGWGGFFSDYRVSPNFLVVLGLRLWLRLGLGCDNNCGRKVLLHEKYSYAKIVLPTLDTTMQTS